MDSTATQGAGLRERKKLATKQALALAALQLAVQRGLENVRVEDITDAVNVSRRTFTNYFSCKEEAIASLNTARFTQAVEALRGQAWRAAERFPGRGVRRRARGGHAARPGAYRADPDDDDLSRAAG